MAKIFLSHNYKDKAIIEPIAIKLALIYGKENVFYDAWSIQPGDGIIDKMNNGLLECDFFFFFVSKNSLQSNMVKLEWQNALLKATRNAIKLVPVKLDDCTMPAILLQNLYIDIFGKGLEYGFRQIVDVINNQNTFQEQFQTYENVRGRITEIENGYKIKISAITYFEPIARFLILVDCDPKKIKVNCTSDTVRVAGTNENIKFDNGLICNALFESVDRGFSPGFPYCLEITNIDKSKFICYGVMRAVEQNKYRMIPSVFDKENA